MQRNAKDKGFGFAYLLDAQQSVYPRYGASKTPEIYLLDADRVLQYHGAIDDSAQDPDGVTINYVESAIAALEKGETPEPREVKAIGCGIKAR
jgi:predicted acetyltransferase